VDELIESHGLDHPQHIKIDVDGDEMHSLKGMERLLGGAEKTETVQVEIHEDTEAGITALMSGFDYRQVVKHYTRSKIKSQRRGEDARYPYNGVFARANS
jgi:hypothetical protein